MRRRHLLGAAMSRHQVGQWLRISSLHLLAAAELLRATVPGVAERAAAGGIPLHRPPEAIVTTEVHRVAAVRHEAAHRPTLRLLPHRPQVRRQVPAGPAAAEAEAAAQRELAGNN